MGLHQRESSRKQSKKANRQCEQRELRSTGCGATGRLRCNRSPPGCARSLDCPDAAPALVEPLKREGDTAVREVILTTLLRLDDPSIGSRSGRLPAQRGCGLRNEAIEAMKQLPDEVAPIMRSLLADPDPDVRIFAVNILEFRASPGGGGTG